MANSFVRFVNGIFLISAAFYFVSCSKESAGTGTTPPVTTDPCAGKTIVITATPTTSSPCSNTGAINVSATGSTGFMFKLNSSGTYRSTGLFLNIGAGDYTVFVKDKDGCEKTTAVTVTGDAAPGPLFTAVKSLVSTACQSCHNGTVQNGGMNWDNQCNIIQFQNRIKIRAVDEGSMPQGGPQLTTEQKAVITDWINAGGRFAD